jgi:hypothetical protein
MFLDLFIYTSFTLQFLWRVRRPLKTRDLFLNPSRVIVPAIGEVVKSLSAILCGDSDHTA